MGMDCEWGRELMGIQGVLAYTKQVTVISLWSLERPSKSYLGINGAWDPTFTHTHNLHTHLKHKNIYKLTWIPTSTLHTHIYPCTLTHLHIYEYLILQDT